MKINLDISEIQSLPIDYKGSEGNLYKKDNLLYKIFKRPQEVNEDKLIIISKLFELDDIAALPIDLLYSNNVLIGYTMTYYKDMVIFNKFVKQNNVNKLKICIVLKNLSMRLRRIHEYDILMTDLKENNFMVDSNLTPFFIDMDGISILNYKDSHISSLMCSIYDIEDDEKKTKKVRNNNIDREVLFVLFVIYILDIKIEDLSRKHYLIELKKHKKFLTPTFYNILKNLKRRKKKHKFRYYLDDFLTDELLNLYKERN